MGEPGSDGGSLRLEDRTASRGPLSLRDEDNDDSALVRHLFETGLGAPLVACGLPPVAVDQLIAQQLAARHCGHGASHPLARRQNPDGRPAPGGASVR